MKLQRFGSALVCGSLLFGCTAETESDTGNGGSNSTTEAAQASYKCDGCGDSKTVLASASVPEC